MTGRKILLLACAVAAVLGGLAWQAHRSAAPACDSDQAQGEVYRVLHAQFHLEGVFLHDFSTTSGGYFSATRACAAAIAEIRGNVDAADLRWRQVHYRVTHSEDSEDPIVTVDLGGATVFNQAPEQTLWTRLLALF